MNIPSFSGCTALIIGDIMLDQYYWGEVDRISPESPVPVLHVKEKTSTLGGAANVARNCAALGCTTHLVGVCGSDEAGALLQKVARERGIEPCVVMTQSHPTTVKTRAIASTQQLIRLDEEYTGGYDQSVQEQVYSRCAQLMSRADVCILSDYNKGLLSSYMCETLIECARKNDVAVFVDPKTTEWGRYTGATAVTPNIKEFREVTSTSIHTDAEIAQHAQRLMDAYSLSQLLVTRGAEGMTLCRPGKEAAHIGTQVQEVYDVSGAGDTVIAVYASAYAAGASPDEAMRIANTAAGIVVGKVGTQPITAEELAARLSLGSDTPGAKVFARDAATVRVCAWKNGGACVGFTNGCFDLLHAGHIKLLHEAAAKVDKLIVAINTDDSVRRLKGTSRPILSAQERATILAALACVDMVVKFDEDTPRELIAALKPDVLIKGGDYTRAQVVGHDMVPRWGGRVELVELVQDKSTSAIVEKLSALRSEGE